MESAAPVQVRGATAVQVAASLGALAVMLALGPVLDADLGFHLRAGAWILEHRALPWTDPFAQQARPWFEYAWAYDLLVHALQSAWGLRGIVAYRVGMTVLIAWAVWRAACAQASSAGTAWLASALALGAMGPALTERSYLFSVLFVALTFDAVFRARAGQWRSAALLVPAYALWANTHVEFVFGVIVLGIACAAPYADARLGWAPRPGREHHKFVAIAAAASLATLLNPAGLGIWKVILFEYSARPLIYRYIVELQPVDFSLWGDWLTALMVLLAIAVLVRGRRRSTLEPLLLAASVVIGFRAKHDIWFPAIAAAPLLARVPLPKLELSPRFRTALGVAKLAAIALGLALVVAGLRAETEPTLQRELASEYPVEAVAAVEAQHLEGPLYNDFNWGGFLIWKLPRLKVVSDGRTPQYTDDELRSLVRTWRGQAKPGEEDPALLRANLVIAATNSGLTPQLRADPRWRLVHEDPVALVFVRAR